MADEDNTNEPKEDVIAKQDGDLEKGADPKDGLVSPEIDDDMLEHADSCFVYDNLDLVSDPYVKDERLSDVNESQSFDPSSVPMTEFFEKSLIRNGGPRESASAIGSLGHAELGLNKALGDNTVIGFYFAAYSNTASRRFTEGTLKEAYAKWKEHEYPIEIIFISQNENDGEFNVDFADNHGKWLAMGWDEAKQKSLVNLWKIDGIPALVFVNRYWDVLSRNGIITVSSQWEEGAKELMNKHHETEALREEARKAAGYSVAEVKEENGEEIKEPEGQIPTKAGPDLSEEGQQCACCLPLKNKWKERKERKQRERDEQSVEAYTQQQSEVIR